MTTLEKLKQYLAEIKKNNKKINAFLELRPEKELIEEARKIDAKKNKGRLAGKIIGVKANICVKGLHASCASKTLENYNAPYDAHVVEKIKAEDGLIIGMLNCDEFASGSSGETSAFGPIQNPVVLGRIPGGSSSGSAAAIAAGFCDITLGSDTGGSIRCPASYCGVVGMKPTYSSVSRYGLIDLAMSTDTIGALAKNVEDVALMMEVISGKDERDAICQSEKIKRAGKLGKMTIGVLDLSGLKVDVKIQKIVDDKIKEVAEKNGWNLKKIKLDYLDLAVETYYPIIYVEAFSGTRKLDGRRFGKKVEDSCGPEFLRRILGGAEISQAEHAGRYYYLALKAKALIGKEFEKAFGSEQSSGLVRPGLAKRKEVDCVVCPVMPVMPWKIGEKISVEEAYAADALTIPSSLAGNCAMSVPAGEVDGIPVGMQIICDKFEDGKLLGLGREIEKLSCGL